MNENRIRYWRKLKNISQVQLAASLGTDQGTVSRLEKGEQDLTPDWQQRLAKALGLTWGIEVCRLADIAGIRDDVRPYREKMKEGLRKYHVVTDILSLAGIPQGSTILVSSPGDGEFIDPEELSVGDRVIAKATSVSDTGHGLILREVVARKLLSTRGRGMQIAIDFNDPDLKFQVIGTVAHVWLPESAANKAPHVSQSD